ncbi:nucleoside phosphorylase [Phenylobacterium sp.]|uniref:nucleoside phosphorylase n=1 Tax=Phenylobacterium sp. TaxID=1871053 RepID=UPI003BAB9656
MTEAAPPPIVRRRAHAAPSVFQPQNLLREARRQKGLAVVAMPQVCVLDPDGDLVRRLTQAGRAHRDPSWACYHTDLHRTSLGGREIGIVGCAVGAAFAVLVAEQLFASGCELLISVTSAGQLAAKGAPPYFVLIEKALRDEGVSYHYLPPGDFSAAPLHLLQALEGAFDTLTQTVHLGAVWTTDAPFRETADDIDALVARGLVAVEMEAAGLYAMAQARGRDVVCFAHVTNQMGQAGDFEKGEADGVTDSLAVIQATIARVQALGAARVDARAQQR